MIMNATRQYSSPNCNLILEGIEDSDPENADILSGRAPISAITNAECHFLRLNKKLSGGNVFLANLTKAANNYAQGFLSGLFPPDKSDHSTGEYPQISIAQVSDQDLHRLTFAPDPNSDEAKTEIDLTTVELFDLVEAIDQLYTDPSVLPNMTLDLKPVSKRYRQPEQPLAERLTPVAIGLSSLAIAAGALFMLPIPQESSTKSLPLNQTPKTETQTEIPNSVPRQIPPAETSNE